jgi:hypothetical protein
LKKITADGIIALLTTECKRVRYILRSLRFGHCPTYIKSRESEKSLKDLKLQTSLNIQHSDRLAIIISSIVFLFLKAWLSTGVHCIYIKLVTDHRATIKSMTDLCSLCVGQSDDRLKSRTELVN